MRRLIELITTPRLKRSMHVQQCVTYNPPSESTVGRAQRASNGFNKWPFLPIYAG